MDTEARIITALAATKLPISPNVYTGNQMTYIVFRFDSVPEGFAEGTAVGVRELVSVHLYLPNGNSPVKIKRMIATALVTAGCNYPTITNASDRDSQHYVFECEMLQDG